MKFRTLLTFLLVLLFIQTSHAQHRMFGNSFTTRAETIAEHGMAASSQPLVTQIALDILKSGGNAIDAAIAANAAQGLMEPTGNGIGGDLFAIVWDAKTQKLYGLNASGKSPASLSLKDFEKAGLENVPYRGPLSVSVPGAVDGWFELHKKFGSKPMEEILQPAISYAENGFPVSETIAFLMANGARSLAKYPGFKETFMTDGRTPMKGEIFKNPMLGKTLSTIATEGRDAFYKGDIAKTIGKYMKENGGYLSYKDMANHQSKWVEPVSANYRGYDVWELPPNGQGIAALQLLNILEQFDIAEMGFGSAEYIHTFVEAKKLAYEDRAKFYADPDFVDVPVEWLISKAYAKERAGLIQPNAANSYAPGVLENGDTIYLTVADKDGNMVSLIQSNYGGMGSGMTPTGLGFVLQNRGASFSLTEGHANVFEPGKRPFHTIIPAFITKDGKPYVSFGLMGGAMQPQGHAQIVINLIDFDMHLQEAGDAPRIRHTGSSDPDGSRMTDGGEVWLEAGFDSDEIRNLWLRGHTVREMVPLMFGGYQAIMFKNGVYFGATEARKDGQAAGY